MKRKAAEVKTGDPFELKQMVGKYDPIYYAGASGDFNPIHIDPEFGKMVGLGGNILQGLCTMAYAARCQTQFAGDPGALKRLKVRFSSPVRPADTVTVNATVESVEGKRVKTIFKAINQNGEEVIINAFAELELD
jgi:acyl dehydratase